MINIIFDNENNCCRNKKQNKNVLRDKLSCLVGKKTRKKVSSTQYQESIQPKFFFVKWIFFLFFAIKVGRYIAIALFPYVTKWENLAVKSEN